MSRCFSARGLAIGVLCALFGASEQFFISRFPIPASQSANAFSRTHRQAIPNVKLCAKPTTILLASKPSTGEATAQSQQVLSHAVDYEKCWKRQDFTDAEPGVGVESEVFELAGHQWQTIVYPAGQQKVSGFGKKANELIGASHSKQGRVGVYLRFLPREERDFVDAQFALTVKGAQQTGPRFDVSFECGMRFCDPASAEPSDGRTCDWGAHVMPRAALPDFLEGEGGTLRVEVNMTVFGAGRLCDEEGRRRLGSMGGVQRAVGDTLLKAATAGVSEETRRKYGVFWSLPTDVRMDLRVGQVFVPTQRPGSPTWLFNRQRMFRSGLYPGVEYRVMGMTDVDTGRALFSVNQASRPGAATITTRPIYPVTKRLERAWPVAVPLRFAPVVLTQAMYNTATLISTTLLCAAVLSFGLVGRELVSVYKIPSLSMDPTIIPADLVLTEKVTARLGVPPRRGEIVFFSPPDALREVVAKTNGQIRSRDLFVKRVAAVPGDKVTVRADGTAQVNGKDYQGGLNGRGGLKCDLAQSKQVIEELIAGTKEVSVGEGSSFVMGDCADVSIDSRVWGALDNEQVIGRPIVRLWPPSRFGPVQ